MSNDTRVAVSDAAAATDSAHVAQDSSKPQSSGKQSEKNRGAPAEPPIDEKEFGGQAGLDPTRYGDWEKKGRVTDF